jgi:hypothetical protein
LKKIAPKSFGRYFSEKMRPMPKNIAQMTKFRPIWSHWAYSTGPTILCKQQSIEEEED